MNYNQKFCIYSSFSHSVVVVENHQVVNKLAVDRLLYYERYQKVVIYHLCLIFGVLHERFTSDIK